MMNSKSTMVFLAHTPLQVFFVEKIVEHYGYNKGQFVLLTSVATSNPNIFRKIITIPKKNGLSKVLKTWKAKIMLQKLSKTKEVVFFISHTSALLDNYVFYSLKRKRPEILINLFYDGILYFYDFQERYKRMHSIRRLIGLCVGIKYQFEPKIVPFNYIDNGCIYTTISKFTLGEKSKHIEISLNKSSYNSNENNTIVLGGKPSLLTHIEVQDLYKRIIELISRQNTSQHYFKGHHADKSNNFELANSVSMPFIDITQNSPIEEIVQQFNPARIYSYPSSALINLKAMYGSEIEIFCFYIEKKKEDMKKLLPIFEHMKINMEFI